MPVVDSKYIGNAKQTLVKSLVKNTIYCSLAFPEVLLSLASTEKNLICL